MRVGRRANLPSETGNDMVIKHRQRSSISLAAVVAVLAFGVVGPAPAQHAQVRPRAPSVPAGRAGGGPHQHFDGRFSNNHYYYDRGYTIHRPPAGAVGELRGPHGGRYWYQSGNWYRWQSGAWVVWAAPFGVFVPWLPPYFTTVWWNGIPYYYANDTYYVWHEDRNEYEVVTPPANFDQMATTQAPASNQLFVYPKNGQPAAQEATDRYECHRWAVGQTGFDPTAPGGGVAAGEAVQKRNDYFRAEASCLEGRGYTVR